MAKINAKVAMVQLYQGPQCEIEDGSDKTCLKVCRKKKRCLHVREKWEGLKRAGLGRRGTGYPIRGREGTKAYQTCFCSLINYHQHLVPDKLHVSLDGIRLRKINKQTNLLVF